MPVVAGIMGKSIQALSLLFKSLLATEPWLHDPFVLPIPWRKISESDIVTFGFMKDDGLVTPHPPIARALRIVEAVLKQSNHEVSAQLQFTQLVMIKLSSSNGILLLIIG